MATADPVQNKQQLRSRTKPQPPNVVPNNTVAVAATTRQFNAEQMAFHGFSRSTLTGLPILLCDILMVWLAVSISFVAMQFFATTELNISYWGLCSASACCVVIANYVFSAYPGLGLIPSVELRLCTYAVSMVFIVTIASCSIHTDLALNNLKLLLLGAWPLCLATVILGTGACVMLCAA